MSNQPEKITDPQEFASSLIERLDTIENLVRRQAPGRHTLWSYADIAEYLRCEVSTVRKIASTAPGWPRAITPTTDNNGRKLQPRYKADHIIAWVERQDTIV